MIASRNDVCMFNRTKDLVETSNCVCKDHLDKMKELDPVVKDLISDKLLNRYYKKEQGWFDG